MEQEYREYASAMELLEDLARDGVTDYERQEDSSGS